FGGYLFVAECFDDGGFAGGLGFVFGEGFLEGGGGGGVAGGDGGGLGEQGGLAGLGVGGEGTALVAVGFGQRCDVSGEFFAGGLLGGGECGGRGGGFGFEFGHASLDFGDGGEAGFAGQSKVGGLGVFLIMEAQDAFGGFPDDRRRGHFAGLGGVLGREESPQADEGEEGEGGDDDVEPD